MRRRTHEGRAIRPGPRVIARSYPDLAEAPEAADTLIPTLTLGMPLFPCTSFSNTRGTFWGLFWGVVGSSQAWDRLPARSNSGTPRERVPPGESGTR